MSSSSSTTRVNGKSENHHVSRFQSIVTWVLLVFWAFLMAVGVATTVDPDWLDFISMPEKLDTAIKIEEAANTIMDRGNLAEAERLFQKALKIKPDYGNAMIGLGRVYLQLGSIDAASDMFQKSLKYDPFLPDIAYGNLGVVYESRGDFEKALFYYRKAAETAPEATGSLVNIGKIYLNTNKPDSAAIYLRKAVENISDMEVACRASMIFAKRLKHDDSDIVEAIDGKLSEGFEEDLSRYDYDLFLYSRMHSQRSVVAHHMLGISLAIMGRFDEGIEYLEIAEKIAPNDPVIKNDLHLARTEREKAGM